MFVKTENATHSVHVHVHSKNRTSSTHSVRAALIAKGKPKPYLMSAAMSGTVRFSPLTMRLWSILNPPNWPNVLIMSNSQPYKWDKKICSIIISRVAHYTSLAIIISYVDAYVCTVVCQQVALLHSTNWSVWLTYSWLCLFSIGTA